MKPVIIGGIVLGVVAAAAGIWVADEAWTALRPASGAVIVRTEHMPGAHVTYRYDITRATITDVQLEAIKYCRRTAHGAIYKQSGPVARDMTRHAYFDCVRR